MKFGHEKVEGDQTLDLHISQTKLTAVESDCDGCVGGGGCWGVGLQRRHRNILENFVPGAVIKVPDLLLALLHTHPVVQLVPLLSHIEILCYGLEIFAILFTTQQKLIIWFKRKTYPERAHLSQGVEKYLLLKFGPIFWTLLFFFERRR